VVASDELNLPINADHQGMVRFVDADDKTFKSVVVKLKAVLKSATDSNEGA
jgi:hypothetical protein